MAKKHVEILYFPEKDHTWGRGGVGGGDGKRPYFSRFFWNPSLSYGCPGDCAGND